jgi:hypothetical protein
VAGSAGNAGAEAKEAGGEDGRDLAKAFLWRKESGGKVVSHARSPGKELAATFAGDGCSLWGNSPSMGYLLGRRGN